MALVDTRGPGRRPLRVGLINIMPRVEQYERLLLSPLAGAPVLVDPVWIRLHTHAYSSSDSAHIARTYMTYGEATRDAPLDALILTGAPVEELPYEHVTYWRELTDIFGDAQENVPTTLGLCWGGMALARFIGLEKEPLSRKLFGVFEHEPVCAGSALVGQPGEWFWCAQSRHSTVRDVDLESAAAAGTVRLLARGPQVGYSVFATPDDRFVMHLGHPEYQPVRLVEEWTRDYKLGRLDVDPPRNLDLAAPQDLWHRHRATFFARWLALADQRSADPQPLRSLGG